MWCYAGCAWWCCRRLRELTVAAPAPARATPPDAPSAIFSRGVSESAAPPEPVGVTNVLRKTGTVSRSEAAGDNSAPSRTPLAMTSADRAGGLLAGTRFVRSSSAGSVDPTATDQQRRDLTGATDVQPGRIIRTPYIAHVTAGS